MWEQGEAGMAGCQRTGPGCEWNPEEVKGNLDEHLIETASH